MAAAKAKLQKRAAAAVRATRLGNIFEYVEKQLGAHVALRNNRNLEPKTADSEPLPANKRKLEPKNTADSEPIPASLGLERGTGSSRWTRRREFDSRTRPLGPQTNS